MIEEEIKSGETTPAAGEEEKTEQQVVPVSVVQALREEIRDLKEERAIERAMRLQQQQQAPAKQKSPLDDFDDDDVITGADLKKMLPPLIGALGSQIAEVSVQSSKPDMQEVIGKHLPKVLKDKPHLAAALQAIPNPGQRLLMAYEFGITDPDYKGKKVSEEFSKQADKAKENARKPGSLSNVSGQGSRSEANFATMTDEEIEAHYQKVRFGS